MSKDKDKDFGDPNPHGKDDKGHQGEQGNHGRPFTPAPSSAANSPGLRE